MKAGNPAGCAPLSPCRDLGRLELWRSIDGSSRRALSPAAMFVRFQEPAGFLFERGVGHVPLSVAGRVPRRARSRLGCPGRRLLRDAAPGVGRFEAIAEEWRGERRPCALPRESSKAVPFPLPAILARPYSMTQAVDARPVRRYRKRARKFPPWFFCSGTAPTLRRGTMLKS